MAKITFKDYNPNDNLLFPNCIGDFIPKNHKARLVSAIIDNLDISELLSGYKGGGASSYNPRMLLKVIVYSYLNNVYSGRLMERMLSENVVYMWLSGMNRPDFRTINNFRGSRLKGVFEGLFTQIVELLHKEGLVSLNVQYVDGTKIESASNKYTFVWKRSTETNQRKLRERVGKVLSEAEKIIESENTSSELPEMTSEAVAEKTDKILRTMDEKGISRNSAEYKAVKKVKDESVEKLKEYEDKLDILGERNSYSKTDHDATFMRMKEDAMNNGQTKPGYNVQISTENQYITNYGIYQTPGDQGTLKPHLESFEQKYGKQSMDVVADSGYGSEENYEYLLGKGITPYVKYNMFHKEQKRDFVKNPFLPENMFYNESDDYYVCVMGQHLTHIGNKTETSDRGYVQHYKLYMAKDCSGCPLKGLCHKGSGNRVIKVNEQYRKYKQLVKGLLLSEQGLKHRSKRPIEPESTFGDIKYNHGFKRFRLKSMQKVTVEFGLIATAHNIRKYIKSKSAQ